MPGVAVRRVVAGGASSVLVRLRRVRAIDARPDAQARDDDVDGLDEPARGPVATVVAPDEPGGAEPPQGPGYGPRGQTEMVGDHADDEVAERFDACFGPLGEEE